MYHTTNGGKTWENVNFPLFDDSIIYSIYTDRNNKDKIYVGLNDLRNRNFNQRTDQHVFESHDQGKNWTSFALPFADAMVDILGQPQKSESLYIASGGHLFVRKKGHVTEFSNLIESRQIGAPHDLAFHPMDEKII